MKSFDVQLDRHPFSRVVSALLRVGAPSGRLTLKRGGLERRFELVEGELVAESSTDPREHLAQVLVNLGLLDAPRATAAFEAAEATSQPLGEVLISREFLDASRLLEAIAHKAREAFFDCYQWRSGLLRFQADEARPVAKGVQLRLSLGTLERDARGRAEEWRTFHTQFPELNLSFQVTLNAATRVRSGRERHLLELAEKGASGVELLASSGEPPLHNARRLLSMFERGLFKKRRKAGLKLGLTPTLPALLRSARSLLRLGAFESAEALAGQALEQGALGSAQMIFDLARLGNTLKLSDRLLALEGRIAFAPENEANTAALTTDDLYLLKKLQRTRTLRQAIRTAAMGEPLAYRSFQRLITAGVVQVMRPVA